MYRINTKTGESFLTEKPIYVYIHRSGRAYVMCEPGKATGVMYKGTYLPFSDGNSVQEVDAGDEYMPIEKMAAAIKEGVNDV